MAKRSIIMGSAVSLSHFVDFSVISLRHNRRVALYTRARWVALTRDVGLRVYKSEYRSFYVFQVSIMSNYVFSIDFECG